MDHRTTSPENRVVRPQIGWSEKLWSNYIINFHLKCITAHLIIMYSFDTDSSPSEHWITADDSVGCLMRFDGMAYTISHIAAVVPKQPRKSALPLRVILSLWLAPIVFRTAFPYAVSNLFLFSLWQVDALDKCQRIHTFTITVTDGPEANNIWPTQWCNAGC